MRNKYDDVSSPSRAFNAPLASASVTAQAGNHSAIAFSKILIDLLEHFSTLTPSIANLPEDEFGNAYEFLIRKFADESGHTAAESYTNRTLVHLMTLMLDPQPDDAIYDPTCGTGGMLAKPPNASRGLSGLSFQRVRHFGWLSAAVRERFHRVRALLDWQPPKPRLNRCPNQTGIERHIKVRGEANPYDPDYTEYFERRRCFAWRTLPCGKAGQSLPAGV